MSRQSAKERERHIAGQLLGVISELVEETHPGRRAQRVVTLDSVFDRDLGFDSLGRMELLVRLEQIFGVSLPESLLASAESPRELLNALLESEGEWSLDSVSGQEIEAPILEQVEAVPDRAVTLPEVLEWHVEAHPDRPHIYLYREHEAPEVITYQALLQRAGEVAIWLQEHDLQPGGTVALMLPTGADYFYSFFGVLLAGGVPVPIYPPARLSQIEDHLRRHARILANAGAGILITVPEARPVAQLLLAQLEGVRHILCVDRRSEPAATLRRHPSRGGDLAFLQYTSGSTGNPKGVQLSHANLLANVRAMGAALEVDSSDRFISWLPLYHDMGLIGAWFGSLYFACPLVIMSPLTFLARPQRWLWAMHRFRGTLSASPNFGYELCISRIPDAAIEGLDLSSWRLAFNGAEAVSPQTIRRFAKRFSACGFRPEAMTPVYGLAENSVGLTFPPLGRGPLIDRVRRDALTRTGRAVPAGEDEENALEFVACGRPLGGHQLRIVDTGGRELPERREGHLQFRGPSATRGYLHNPEATRKLLQGAWLDTGDLAYTAGGDLYLTGRAKDIIIKAGRNIYPEEVEQVVGEVPGVRKGCVALFGSRDPATGTERIVLLAETREQDPALLQQLREQIEAVVTDLLGMPLDDLVLAPPRTVPKTSSGKIRRAASREIYAQGMARHGRRQVWLQFLRLAFTGLLPQLRRASTTATELAYAGYAWSLFLLFAVPVWSLVVLLPWMKARWSVMRGGARLLTRLLGIRLETDGLEQLIRDRPFVLAANHASYLDGILLVAVLPVRFVFVAKMELKEQFIPRLFLSRIGCEFVERFDARRGLADSRRITDRVQQGDNLLFFPEGTFARMPGLLPFRMGAFMVAAEAGVPVVPVALQGTRSLLRSESWMPRRGKVRISVAGPVTAPSAEWSEVVKLRDRVRQAILQHSGEPDSGN